MTSNLKTLITTFRTSLFAAALVPGFFFAGTASAAQEVSVGKGLPIRVLSVQQYEDRMPTANETGDAGAARFITLVEFTTEACQTLSEENFEIGSRTEGGVQYLQVQPIKDINDCSGAKQEQTFTVATSKVPSGRALVVANPVTVEVLPPVE